MYERREEAQRLASKLYELFNMTIGPAQPDMWNRMDKAGWIEYFEAQICCEEFDSLRRDMQTIKKIADEEGVWEHSQLVDECMAGLDDWQDRFAIRNTSKVQGSTRSSGKRKHWKFPWKRS